MPGTPDFDSYSIEHLPILANPIPHGVRVIWDDGLETRFHAVWLRENSPDPETTHPVTREQALMLSAIPETIAADAAGIEPSGILSVRWNDRRENRYHPGWLRAHAVEARAGHFDLPRRETWGAELAERFPRFDGARVLQDDAAAASWLEALHRVGVTLLEGLPADPVTIERVADRIGPIRPSNFGRVFEVRSKTDAPPTASFRMQNRSWSPGLYSRVARSVCSGSAIAV